MEMIFLRNRLTVNTVFQFKWGFSRPFLTQKGSLQQTPLTEFNLANNPSRLGILVLLNL